MRKFGGDPRNHTPTCVGWCGVIHGGVFRSDVGCGLIMNALMMLLLPLFCGLRKLVQVLSCNGFICVQFVVFWEMDYGVEISCNDGNRKLHWNCSNVQIKEQFQLKIKSIKMDSFINCINLYKFIDLLKSTQPCHICLQMLLWNRMVNSKVRVKNNPSYWMLQVQ